MRYASLSKFKDGDDEEPEGEDEPDDEEQQWLCEAGFCEEWHGSRNTVSRPQAACGECREEIDSWDGVYYAELEDVPEQDKDKVVDFCDIAELGCLGSANRLWRLRTKLILEIMREEADQNDLIDFYENEDNIVDVVVQLGNEEAAARPAVRQGVWQIPRPCLPRRSEML